MQTFDNVQFPAARTTNHAVPLHTTVTQGLETQVGWLGFNGAFNRLEPKQSYKYAGSAFDNHLIFTFNLLISLS